MAQAAQEQLNIQKIRSDRERELARKSINDKFDAERKKLEDEIEKLQNQKDAKSKAAAGAVAGAAKAAEDTQAAKDFEGEIVRIIAKYGGKNTPDAQKALAVAFNTAKSSKDPSLVKTAKEMEGQYKATGPSFNSAPGPSELANRKSTYDVMFDSLSKDALAKAEANDKFSDAVENFISAVETFTGKKVPTKKTPQINTGKAGSTSAGGISLPAPVKSSSKSTTLGGITLPNFGRAMGGYISGAGNGTSDSIPAMLSNGEYVINAKSVKSVGMPMLDRINKMAMGGPVYNVPAYSIGGRVKYNNGGMATSSNSLYNINVTLNGTDMSADDVANAIERKMRIREATIGRGRNN
jgi:hypothetical protein